MSVTRAAGAKRILFADDRLGAPSHDAEGSNSGARRLHRSHVIVAKTERGVWQSLLQDWARDGLKYSEDHLILTQTRFKADALNNRAQAMRKKAGRLGERPTKVGECDIYQNDRIIFRTGNHKLNIEPLDVGTVIKVNALKIRVALDGGRTVELSTKSCPWISLAYALAHSDAEKVKTQRAHVLFEANDAPREMDSILNQRSRTPVRIHVSAENAAMFTAEGREQMRDKFRDQKKQEKEREEAQRTKRTKEDKRRQEDDERRRPERKEQWRAEQARQHSQGQSHSHSH